MSSEKKKNTEEKGNETGNTKITDNKKMFMQILYMAYGKKVLEILIHQKKICFNNEMIRKFMIGILVSINKRIKDCESEIFEKTGNKTENKLNILRLDPFILGCTLGYIPDKEMKSSEVWTKNTLSDTVKLKIAKILWQRFNLEIEECQLFLSPINDFSSSEYISLYYDLCNYKNMMDEVDENSITKDTFEKATEYEEMCVRYAERFYKKWLRFVGKWEFRIVNRFSLVKKIEDKWSADAIKMEYYERCWSIICKKAGADVNSDLFFSGLKTEIDDINRRASDMCTKRNKEQSRIITFSILATIFNALATGLTSISEYELEKEVGSELWKSIINAAPLITLAISTSFTALFTGFNYFKEHNDYEETWLRHQLNRSRLTGELEKFCEGLGEYSCINKITYESEDCNNIEEIRKAIRTFQKNIYLLRKQDDANFFSNMNCINFDKDDYKFDDNDGQQSDDDKQKNDGQQSIVDKQENGDMQSMKRLKRIIKFVFKQKRK